HLGAVDREANLPPPIADRELVRHGVLLDGAGARPRDHVDPARLVALPDANITLVAHLEHQVASLLARPVERSCALVADDQPAAAAGRSARLAEAGGQGRV